nr:unnamed protein product [Spirometra erinaceieuropaei]
MTRVKLDGPVPEAFSIADEVKQICVLPIFLLSFMFTAMLIDAYRNELTGISIVYRTNDRLLNTQRKLAPTRLSATTAHDLSFVED